MRRHSALRSLTSEHHTGLVIARRARQAAREGGLAQTVAWKDVKARFRAEIEGHFRRAELERVQGDGQQAACGAEH